MVDESTDISVIQSKIIYTKYLIVYAVTETDRKQCLATSF